MFSSTRLNDYIDRLKEDEFYDIGGGEQPVHQYCNAWDMKLSTALAKNCTIVDCMDEEEVQTVMPFDKFKFAASCYVTADMDKPIDVEPKVAAIVKDALVCFEHTQGYENILSMVQEHGMIIIIDNAYVINKFRLYVSDRMFTSFEAHHPFCTRCGEEGVVACKEVGGCKEFAPYGFAVFIKSDPFRDVQTNKGES